MAHKFKGHAVQVVTLDGPKENRKLRLHTQVLRSITDEAKGYNIAAIAIAGPARGGKSFILTYIIRYLKALEKAKNGKIGDWMETNDPEKSMYDEGFSFRNGTKRTTDGIWMWSRPFIVELSPRQNPVAIVVIDTEGCFDATSSEKEQSCIIGLSLLASSYFIFNESTKINENTLLTLAKFMQYGQLASRSFDNKSFQKLMFLVRDWNMPGTHPYGAGGGQQFMEKSMVPDAAMSKEAIECRQAILRSFEQQDAYLMPHPGEDVIADDFQGSISEMTDSFQDHIERFTIGLVSDVEPKKVSDTPIDGPSFYTLLENYVLAFNSEDMPSPANILKANTLVAFEAILQKHISEYEGQFKAKLSSSDLPFIPLDVMQQWHVSIARNVSQSFGERANIGSAEENEVYTQKFTTDMDRIFYQYRQINEEKQNTFVQSTESLALSQFCEHIEANVLPADKFWTETEFNNFVSKAEERAKKSFLKACDFPEKFVNDQQILFNSKLQEVKDKYWSELGIKRRSVEDRLSILLDEIEAYYTDILSVPVSETITTDALANLHWKQLEKAVEKFKTKVTDISDQIFLSRFEEDLVSRLNFKYQVMNTENQYKLQTFLDQAEVDINDAAELLRNELERLVPETDPLDFSAMEAIYEDFLKTSYEHLEGQPISTKILLEYQRSLEKSLKEVIKEVKDAVRQSKTAMQERCQQQVQTAVIDFIHRINSIKQENRIVSNEELNFKINSIHAAIRSTLRLKIAEEDRDQVENSLAEYNARTVADQQRIQLDNMDRLKDFDYHASTLSTSLVTDYTERMDNYQRESTSMDQLQDHHRSTSADIVNRFNTDLRNRYNDLELSVPYKERLAAELDQCFEDIRTNFGSKLSRERLAKEELLAKFQADMKSTIDGNPFISNREYKKILEEAEEQCEIEFKNYFPSNGRNQTKNQSLINLQARMDDIKGGLEDYKKAKLRECKRSIDGLIHSISAEAESQIKLRIDSLTVPNQDLLDTEIQSVEAGIKLQFDHYWTFKDSEHKDIAWVEVQTNVRPQLERAKVKQLERIENDKKVAFAASHNSLSNESSTFVQGIQAGLVFTRKSFEKHIETEQRKNQEYIDNYCRTHSIKINEEERRGYANMFKQNCEAWKQRNQQNEEKLVDELKTFCKSYFRAREASCNNDADLRNLSQNALHECKIRLREKCAENIDLYPDLKNSIAEICDTILKGIIQDKTENVDENGILQRAIQDYRTNMDTLLKNARFSDDKQLALLHRESVNKIIREIKTRNYLTESMEAKIDLRLQKSLQVYDNRLLLKNTMQNVAVGIDLGTTTSCVAIHRGDKVEVIKDNSGESLIPSYVCFAADGGTKVGKAAKEERHLHPEHTIFDSKRLIGRAFSDKIVQEDIKTWPFDVVERNGKLKIVARSKEYDPEDISAHILKHMKKMASDKLGVEIKKAVITVPANFDDRQRDATRQAAQIAGLEVLQIINEPTAAAMAYSLSSSHEDKIVLVYDFGGGTFDVTILKASAADLEVLTTLGDTHLGGEDFDHNMVLYCVGQFKELHLIDLLQIKNKSNAQEVFHAKRRMARLRNACEKTKANLSSADSATVNADAIHGALDLSVTITRAEFEKMNMSLFKKSIDIVDEAIKKVNLKPRDINEVLMVGGSSRIPKVKDMLQEYLGLHSLIINDEVDIQEAVARGAATQACILAEGGSSVMRLVKDVTPFSLGIKVSTGEMSVIIKKDSSIPTEAEDIYTTLHDNQTSVNIEIFSGEDPVAINNKLLGNFILDGIPPERRGKQNVTVKMHINTSGILEVTAICVSTGGSQNLIIKEKRGRLSDKEIEQKRKELGS